MSESTSHINLVKSLVSWVSENILEGDKGYILADLPDMNSKQKPPQIKRYIPDLYVPERFGSDIIIGEAKTANDIERKHSIDQIDEFLVECSKYKDSIFVFAAPWFCSRLSMAILNERLQINSIKVSTVIIEKLAG